MKVQLQGGPADGEIVEIDQLEQDIVLEGYTRSTPTVVLANRSDLMYTLISTQDMPVYEFKAYLTLD